MNRRSVLNSLVVGVGCFVAGCGSRRSGDDTETRLEVFVANHRSDPLTAEVTGFRRENRIFSHTYQLGAGKADEAQSMPTAPTRIVVNVDGRSTEHDFAFPSSCESLEINILIDSEGPSINNGCHSG